ncbi:unnamed protein product [Ectocarpus fasciculatus]
MGIPARMEGRIGGVVVVVGGEAARRRRCRKQRQQRQQRRQRNNRKRTGTDLLLFRQQRRRLRQQHRIPKTVAATMAHRARTGHPAARMTPRCGIVHQYSRAVVQRRFALLRLAGRWRTIATVAVAVTRGRRPVAAGWIEVVATTQRAAQRRHPLSGRQDRSQGRRSQARAAVGPTNRGKTSKVAQAASAGASGRGLWEMGPRSNRIATGDRAREGQKARSRKKRKERRRRAVGRGAKTGWRRSNGRRSERIPWMLPISAESPWKCGIECTGTSLPSSSERP